MEQNGRGRIVADGREAAALLGAARRVAVLGIKPETHASAAAHYVPAYLKDVGYEVVPVPTYFPDVQQILGEPVYRQLADVPGAVDMVVVFRRPQDIPGHVDDIIGKKPRTVWFQAGIRHTESAERLAAAGIDVVQDRCTMIEHRRVSR
jgi:uncharacterized protein